MAPSPAPHGIILSRVNLAVAVVGGDRPSSSRSNAKKCKFQVYVGLQSSESRRVVGRRVIVSVYVTSYKIRECSSKDKFRK